MDVNRYNTRVRQAISDRYVACGKRKQEIDKEVLELRSKLSKFMDGDENLTYKEYIDIRSTLNQLNQEDYDLDIKRSVWDEARELCLDIADEMDGN